MRTVSRWLAALLFCLSLFALTDLAHAELKPDELLLIVNGNAPASVKAAEFYAKQRAIPDGRICKLDLPLFEEIPFDLYEKNVVPPVRKFLREGSLDKKVRCLVLFFGTPIRIASPTWDAAAQAEVTAIRAELAASDSRVMSDLTAYETLVGENVPDFLVPPPGGPVTPELVQQRLDRAGRAVGPALDNLNSEKRAALLTRLQQSLAPLIGDAGLRDAFAKIELAQPGATPETAAKWADIGEKVKRADATILSARDRRFDPLDRARHRDTIRDTYGLLRYALFLREQLGYFGTDAAMASLDSELVLLWVDYYRRASFLANPMYYGPGAPPYNGPPLLMTARLDGPDVAAGGLMLLASLKAEREGLTGKVVIDSRGKILDRAKPDPYAVYDETLRRLAALLKSKTSLKVVLDENEAVLPPDSVKDVALYAGWYSVGNYIPSMKFHPGAVGYHIASYEMLTLRDPNSKGWVPNLIRDGIAATLGPVAEPYLHAFPEADEFFPLLLTGRLTLAECYWKTQKTISWQVALVGDPLYRPYLKNPPLLETDLPGLLSRALLK